MTFRRRDVRLQSRWFAHLGQSLTRSPTPTGFAQIVSDDPPVLYAHLSAMTYLESGISRVAGNLFTR
jgi:hypothetical protein